jgi:hypothetical protein
MGVMGARIFIGIPSNREDVDFLASVNSLLSELRGHYDVTVVTIKWHDYPTALNKIIDLFLSTDCEHLLFLDDDHTGHTKAMVDTLYQADKDFIGMHTYCRKFPFFGLLIKEEDGVFSSEEHEKGIHEIHITGTSMLLMKRRVFELLSKPFFGKHSVEENIHCESNFCFRLRDIGVKMYGCWDFCLDHGGITKDNVVQMRRDKAPSYLDRMMAALKKEN